MQDFTQLIKTINEGVILRWHFKDRPISAGDRIRILSKEKTSITALCGKLAAEITGLPKVQVELAEGIGYNLGMAWAVGGESLNLHLTQTYLQQARTSIEKLNDNESQILLELYLAFVNELPSKKE